LNKESRPDAIKLSFREEGEDYNQNILNII